MLIWVGSYEARAPKGVPDNLKRTHSHGNLHLHKQLLKALLAKPLPYSRGPHMSGFSHEARAPKGVPENLKGTHSHGNVHLHKQLLKALLAKPLPYSRGPHMSGFSHEARTPKGVPENLKGTHSHGNLHLHKQLSLFLSSMGLWESLKIGGSPPGISPRVFSWERSLK